ncbi:hypothetical protein AAG570_007303 [Ranatra chinensis]|uniref:EFR3-like protein n=1 Tax=Ranatra chinensis TaxID=642074 RepID=A0ABD0XWN1_9HEMI
MRPRYKRLVDNIFPQLPQDGLVKSNMEKLVFYSLSSPEKLDRIGEYLFQRASRDISRKRNGFVVIAMEAMDQLLVACHAQTLNLFVESFLRMIQKLLESTEPDLQVLATQSFVKFANIEEDTPSYHRRYDFFVSKFSSMCHSNHSNPEVRITIRTAGIRGLEGVIRKTVADDLVENIWEANHMDKILPSLLYNMQDSKYYKDETGSPEVEDKNDPALLADACIRELVSRASFGHVRSVLRPVLRHFDLHGLWVPNSFAVHTFRIIMCSIQSQYSYAVVESLMSHLDENSDSSPKIRTSITHVLSKIIAISAEESVGPSVLEVINSLLGHVRMSASKVSDTEEAQYREALIGCLGEFTAHLPDYQKVEIMVFIMSKIPQGNSRDDSRLQLMLLKSLLTVGKRYTNIAMNTTFPVSLLDPLLRLCLSGGIDTALMVQGILHVLLDRHSNAEKLSRPTLDVADAGLAFEPCSRSDTIFMRKFGEEIYTCLLEILSLNDVTVECIESIYTTLALIAVELLTAHTITAYLTMVYSIQEIALSQNNSLSFPRRYNLHAVVAALLVLVPEIMQIAPLKEYAGKLIGERRSAGAAHLLPELLVTYPGEVTPPAFQIPVNLLVDQAVLGECLQAAGLDTTVMTRSLTHRHSWVESTGVTMRGSVTDLNSTDVESANSTPGLPRKYPEEELSFEAMKRVLADSTEATKEEEKQKREQLFNAFRNTTFKDIVNNNTVRFQVVIFI